MIGRPQEIIAWLFQQDRDTFFDIDVAKDGRSLDQNAYYWALVGKLAAKLRMGHDEVHRMLIREYAPYVVVSVRDDVPLDEHFRYYDVIGQGRANGRTFNHVRVFTGSSEMDAAEMSRLVDGIRQECAQQGIDYRTPEERASMAMECPA